ncbi:MAG: translesion error-prone DNA polymerase V autoproteolytic subunit [Oceanococcaceae bacterium]
MEPARLDLPFVHSPAPQAGFPSPAADYVDDAIDLNRLMVANPPATFFVRVQGQSMEGLHIVEDDVACVDRALQARPGHTVIAVFQGDLYIKKLERRDGRLALCSRPRPERVERYPPMFLDEDEEAVIWGVVTGLLRGVNRPL